MGFNLSRKVEESLVNFKDFDWYEAVLKATRAADQGNQRAFVEVVRSVRSSERVTGMKEFQNVVLSQCHLLQSNREKLECAIVCHELGFIDYCYENLKSLSDINYWPAQYQLGHLLLSDENYKKFPDDGHLLLRASSGPGHREGALMSLTFRARDARVPLRYWYLFRAFLMVPFLAGREKKFGMPEEQSQLDE